MSTLRHRKLSVRNNSVFKKPISDFQRVMQEFIQDVKNKLPEDLSWQQKQIIMDNVLDECQKHEKALEKFYKESKNSDDFVKHIKTFCAEQEKSFSLKSSYKTPGTMDFVTSVLTNIASSYVPAGLAAAMLISPVIAESSIAVHEGIPDGGNAVAANFVKGTGPREICSYKTSAGWHGQCLGEATNMPRDACESLKNQFKALVKNCESYASQQKEKDVWLVVGISAGSLVALCALWFCIGNIKKLFCSDRPERSSSYNSFG